MADSGEGKPRVFIVGPGAAAATSRPGSGRVAAQVRGGGADGDSACDHWRINPIGRATFGCSSLGEVS